MSDLISRSALFNALATAKDKADCFAAIRAAPTVDAVPVRHGHWMNLKNGNATCSECGRTFRDVYDFDNADDYCRHCGAKMYEEV